MLKNCDTPFSVEVDSETPLGMLFWAWPLTVGFESTASLKLVWDLVADAEIVDMAGGAPVERVCCGKSFKSGGFLA